MKGLIRNFMNDLTYCMVFSTPIELSLSFSYVTLLSNTVNSDELTHLLVAADCHDRSLIFLLATPMILDPLGHSWVPCSGLMAVGCAHRKVDSPGHYILSLLETVTGNCARGVILGIAELLTAMPQAV